MARAFIESEIGELLDENLVEALKDGMILCNLLNKLKPGLVTGHKKSTIAFGQMENIGKFLKGCQNWGIKSTDLFQTPDLYEAKNMVAVIDTILAVKRKAGK
eukprot:TRINITY_DN17297_c0_g1_i5.p1 TRINITY_DN17297_c0_g1~~TRINITY_DN17297_c0_g1_i5.p1  ORF type:complete len:102 (-),score=9.12 TRINITY_DN17297_c0_g1_i5:32-337(-)